MRFFILPKRSIFIPDTPKHVRPDCFFQSRTNACFVVSERRCYLCLCHDFSLSRLTAWGCSDRNSCQQHSVALTSRSKVLGQFGVSGGAYRTERGSAGCWSLL